MTEATVPLDTLLAHRPFVTALARALAPDAATADDIAQETWTAAVVRPPRTTGSLRAWLATVVRREARRVWRTESRRAAREAAAAPPETPVAPSAAEVAARAELHGMVVQAVLALDEPARSVVLLRYFEGIDCAGIARRENIPAATVRKRLERALDILRARLDSLHSGDRRAWTILLFPGMDAGAPAASTAVRVRRFRAVAAALAVMSLAGLAWFAAPGSDGPGAFVPAGADAAPPPPGDAAAAANRGDAGQRAEPSHTDAPQRSRTLRAGEAAPGAASQNAVGTQEASVPPAPGLVVTVVDEEGALLREGTLRLRATVPDDAPKDARSALAALPAVIDLADANPFTSAELPQSVGGMMVHAAARAAGRPPTAETTADLSGNERIEIRIVAPRAAALTVVVVESGTGTPIGGARVVSLSESARREPGAGEPRPAEPPASATTAPDGSCILDDLAPGAHRLKVTAPGHTPRRVDARTGDTCRVELAPGAAGTVIARCTRLDGAPSAGDHVSIGEELGITGADGTVVLRDIPQGEQELFLMEQMIGRAPRGQAGSDRSGCWMGEHRFVMEPGATIEVGVGWVRGDAEFLVEVTDRAGRAVPGVRVTLIEPGIRTSDTSADGVSRFRDLPGGTVRFEVEREDGRPQWMWTEPSRLRPGESRRRRVVLADADLAGTVTADGAAAPADTVVILGGAGLYEQRTQLVGGAGFSFRDVPAGRWWIRAEAPGLVSVPVVVDVPESGEPVRAVALTLVRGGIVVFDPRVRTARRLVSGAGAGTAAANAGDGAGGAEAADAGGGSGDGDARHGVENGGTQGGAARGVGAGVSAGAGAGTGAGAEVAEGAGPRDRPNSGDGAGHRADAAGGMRATAGDAGPEGTILLVADGRAVAPAWDESRGVAAGPFPAGTLVFLVSGTDGVTHRIEARIADGVTVRVALPSD